MSADDAPSSSPSGGWASIREELAYYKSQYETLEVELQEFQTSSKELEAELERDVEESEKRERKLQEKAERLGFEVEEWKVCRLQDAAAQNCRTTERTSTNLHARPNTSRARPRPTMRRIRYRKRSRLCATASVHSSSSCGISRCRAMTLSVRHETRRPHWKMLSPSTTFPLSAGS